jgi:hypothetical protein
MVEAAVLLHHDHHVLDVAEVAIEPSLGLGFSGQCGAGGQGGARTEQVSA